MKIGVIIPTRGDRPDFLKHSLRFLKNQTVQPDIVELVDFKPTSKEKDITKRYRIGYDKLRNRGLDVIAFWEDDEYYAPNYFETMLSNWNDNNRPEIFGPSVTIYYNLLVRGYFKFHHTDRSNAMCTFIKPDLNFKWPVDTESYLDTHLWMVAAKDLGWNYQVFKVDQPICLGIKHNTGLKGGQFHTDHLYRYREEHNGTSDKDLKFLSKIVDPETLDFYKQFYIPDYELQRGVFKKSN